MMFSPFLRLFAATLTLGLAPVVILRAEPDIIAKARAYLGPEEALNAVKSVHYTGTASANNLTDPAKPLTGKIDIIFQAPYFQRTMRTSGTLVDTVALDTYDGWHRVEVANDASRWRMQVLPTDQVKRQRAIVLENLSFYRGMEQAGVKVVDLGSTTLDGVACRKIEFIHSPDITFFRYFEEATGRLVLSETEGGNAIREEGEIIANGIRYPKAIINTFKDKDGKEQKITITFDSITLNETFPASTFAIPSFSGK